MRSLVLFAFAPFVAGCGGKATTDVGTTSAQAMGGATLAGAGGSSSGSVGTPAGSAGMSGSGGTAGGGGGGLVGNEDLEKCGTKATTSDTICSEACYSNPSYCTPTQVCCFGRCRRGVVNDFMSTKVPQGNGTGCFEFADCAPNGAAVPPLPFCM